MANLVDKSAYVGNSAYYYSTAYTTSTSALDDEYGESIYANPSLSGPNIGLGNGKGLGISGYSNITGGNDTDWTELQWMTPGYFTSANMQTGHVDSTFGTALGYWNSTDGSSSSTYAIYDNPGGYVYQVATEGGHLNDVLLQSKTVSPGLYTFDHPIVFTANEAVMNLTGSQNVYQLGNNFIVSYNHDGMRADFFLQVQVYDSRDGGIVPYTSIKSGVVQTSGVSSLTGGIYNVTSGLYQSMSQSPSLTSANVDGAVQQVTSNMDGLHTVTVDVNQALMKMIQFLYANNPGLGNDVLNLSNWSLTTAYVGTESGYETATGDFYIQNPEVHYDANATYSSSTIGKSISTIQGLAGQAMGQAMTTTATVSGTNYVLKSASENIVSTGAWDNIDANGQGVVAYVQNGLAVNGNNGSLTLSGPGSSYLAGQYKGLYVTLNANSVVNAALSGTASVHNGGGNTSLTGDNAGLTFDGQGYTNIVGSYSSLVLNTLQAGQTVYASASGASYINNMSGTVNLTANGYTYFNNTGGVSWVSAGSTLNLYNSAGNVILTGTSLGNSTLNYNGGAGYTGVYGSWSNIEGAMASNVLVNAKVQNDVHVYNQGADINLTGNYSSLTYNSDESGHGTFVGDWYSATATFGQNDVFNASLQTGFMTIENGANVSIVQKQGNQAIGLNIDGGTTTATYGKGFFNINVDAAHVSTLTLYNYQSGHGVLAVENASSAQATYDASRNQTDIHVGSANIIVLGNHTVVSNSVGSGLILNMSS